MPTVAQVARKARVSYGTASMAIRGVGRVAAHTRDKVLRVARQMGHVGNPAAALLARQRKPHRKNSRFKIAFLTTETAADPFMSTCDALGLSGVALNPASLGGPEETSRILWQRGVDGLLVDQGLRCWSREERARFEWARFSTVKLGAGLPDLPCHLVRHDAFRYLDHTLEQVTARGYRRLCVLLQESVSASDDDQRFGALFNFQQRKLPVGASLEWRCLPATRPREAVSEAVAWLRRRKPDAVVIFHSYLVPILENAAFVFPRDFGVAAVLSFVDANITPPLAGCHVHSEDRFDRSLRLLLEQLGRGERGFSPRPMEYVIEPEWFDSPSLPLKT